MTPWHRLRKLAAEAMRVDLDEADRIDALQAFHEALGPDDVLNLLQAVDNVSGKMDSARRLWETIRHLPEIPPETRDRINKLLKLQPPKVER